MFWQYALLAGSLTFCVGFPLVMLLALSMKKEEN